MKNQINIPATEQAYPYWFAHIFITLTFYSYGTAMMDYFLVYPSRHLIGEKEFVVYHALLDERIMPISVFPFLILTLLNVLLFWLRPASLPKMLILASFICLFIDWISTIFIQIPMNLQLNEGKDIEVIQAVMNTNWGRIFLESAQALLAFRMMQLISMPRQDKPVYKAGIPTNAANSTIPQRNLLKDHL